MAVVDTGTSMVRSVTEPRQAVSKAFELLGHSFTESELRDEIDRLARLAQVVLDCRQPEGQGKTRYLDIGTGAGYLPLACSLMGIEAYGLDDFNDPWHSPETVSGFRKIHAENGVRLVTADVFDGTGFEEDYFDIVSIIDVIEHLHCSPAPVMKEIYRILKPGGRVIVAIPNSVNLRKRLSVIAGRSNLVDFEYFYHQGNPFRGHVREYTLQEAKTLLTHSGFVVRQSTMLHTLVNRKFNGGLKKLVFKYPYLAITMVVPTLRDNCLVVGEKPLCDRVREETNELSLSVRLNAISPAP